MQIQLPDDLLMQAWRSAIAQLWIAGPGQYWHLGGESARAVHAMDQCGMFSKSERVYDHFLALPGDQQDGDFADGDGALERCHLVDGICWLWEGTHPGTGMLLAGMSRKFLYTGDRAWFEQRRQRLTAAADWIVRQRDLYMKHVPNRTDLEVAGQHPPTTFGDSSFGGSAWWFYHCMDGQNVQGLEYFSQALAQIDPEASRKYADHARRYRDEVRRSLRRQALLSPVRLGLDGTYRTYLPAAAYTGGRTIREIRMQQYACMDVILGVDIARDGGILSPDDSIIDGTVTYIEERLSLGEKAVASGEWFWRIEEGGFAKDSYNGHVYLLRDDVPGFLRWWHAQAAAFVHPKNGTWMEKQIKGDADGATAGWFAEMMRKSLVMEQGDVLWLARATPRAYLAQGKRITAKDAPTIWGPMAYEIASDADNGRITAKIELPSRRQPSQVVLRLRHPVNAPLKAVTVDGKPWTAFDATKETITLKGLGGTVAISASY
jgi:hypothetical protein